MKLTLCLFTLTVVHFSSAQFGGFGGFGGGNNKPSPSGNSGGGGSPFGGLGGGSNPLGGGSSGGSSNPFGLPIPNVGVPELPNLADTLGFDICSVFKLTPSILGGDIISGACNMAKGWQKGVGEAIKTPGQYRSILTDDQRKYWDRVVGCHSVQCICDYWPKCRDLKVDIVSLQKNNNPNFANVTARYGRVVRKDIRAMEPVERRRFFWAMNKLKFDKIDGWSKYDIITGYHAFIPFVPAAHFSAGLLPFHRELLKNFEVALRMEHPLATFPYWDTTLDAEMPNPRDSVMWSDELMGAGSGNTSTGPWQTFAGEANTKFPTALYTGGVSRAVGAGASGALLNKDYENIILNKGSMSELVFCRDPFLDTVHAAVHIYVGGLMADPASSPGDPLFYLFHCFIDSIWEQWRQKHQNRQQRETDYAFPCPYNPFDLPEAPLLPFQVKVKDAYSNVYTDEFYTYQDWPDCTNGCQNPQYLVCKKSNGRCMSKVKVGGDCSGLDTSASNPCYNGMCKSAAKCEGFSR